MKPLELKMEDSQRDKFSSWCSGSSPPRALIEASRLVVVRAIEWGNGCSWICARMAEVLAAQVAASVCVVDANLRSPQAFIENLA